MNDMDYSNANKPVKHGYIDTINALRNAVHAKDIDLDAIDALIDELECYASRLSNAYVMDDSPSALPMNSYVMCAKVVPPPEDIAVGRDCVDRIMKHSNRPDSLLTDSEAWNLLFLFELAYPSDPSYKPSAYEDTL